MWQPKRTIHQLRFWFQVVTLRRRSSFYAGSGDCVVYGVQRLKLHATTRPAANSTTASCEYLSCAGCTDPTACNYDDTATLDNASCDYSCIGCSIVNALNYCADVHGDDPECAFVLPRHSIQLQHLDSSVTASAAPTEKVLTL